MGSPAQVLSQHPFSLRITIVKGEPGSTRPVDERYREWLLKNSLSASNSQTSGDGKCLPASRKSLISHPDASQFLQFLEKRVFQQPRDLSPTIYLERLTKPDSQCLNLGIASLSPSFFSPPQSNSSTIRPYMLSPPRRAVPAR